MTDGMVIYRCDDPTCRGLHIEYVDHYEADVLVFCPKCKNEMSPWLETDEDLMMAILVDAFMQGNMGKVSEENDVD